MQHEIKVTNPNNIYGANKRYNDNVSGSEIYNVTIKKNDKTSLPLFLINEINLELYLSSNKIEKISSLSDQLDQINLPSPTLLSSSTSSNFNFNLGSSSSDEFSRSNPPPSLFVSSSTSSHEYSRPSFQATVTDSSIDSSNSNNKKILLKKRQDNNYGNKNNSSKTTSNLTISPSASNKLNKEEAYKEVRARIFGNENSDSNLSGLNSEEITTIEDENLLYSSSSITPSTSNNNLNSEIINNSNNNNNNNNGPTSSPNSLSNNNSNNKNKRNIDVNSWIINQDQVKLDDTTHLDFRRDYVYTYEINDQDEFNR